MKKQAIFVLVLVFGISSFAFAQSKTVTNKTLEKYRQKRLQAERDLQENYAEMGFPSPEEMERQNEESSRERSELAQRLREERLQTESLKLERERINLDRQSIQTNNAQDNYSQDNYSPAYSYPNPAFIDYSRYGSTSYVYPGYYGRGVFRGNRRGNFRDNRWGNTYNNRRWTNFYPGNVRRNNNRRTGIRSTRRGFNNQRRFHNRGGNRIVFSIGGRVRGN